MRCLISAQRICLTCWSVFKKMSATAGSAAVQVNDEAFFATLGAEYNGIAVAMKHMAGNLKSRFSDFLTADGETPDRNRNGEFQTAASEARRDVEPHWERGWQTLSIAPNRSLPV